MIPGPTDFQGLERDSRSVRKLLKGSTKELQPLWPVSWLMVVERAMLLRTQVSCAIGMHLGMDEEPINRSGLKGGQGQVTLQRGSATGCLSGKTKEMSPSTEKRDSSWSQALILTGDFNQPNICWRSNTAEHGQSRRFLECLGEYFLLQVNTSSSKRSQ